MYFSNKDESSFSKLLVEENSMYLKTIIVIERIDNEIEDKYIKEYILKESNKLDEIVIEYKDTNNLDIDKIIFFAWYNLNIEEININDISNYYNELISQNYTDNDNYRIKLKNISNEKCISNIKVIIDDILNKKWEKINL